MKYEPPKKPWSAKGARDNCPRFALCPLCYGCRNFDKSVQECLDCEKDNAKQNICKTDRHTSENLSRMIRKETIIVE